MAFHQIFQRKNKPPAATGPKKRRLTVSRENRPLVALGLLAGITALLGLLYIFLGLKDED
jgi:hypothetical protein